MTRSPGQRRSMTAARAAMVANARNRRDRYADLRRRRYTPQQAAQALGISGRTADRYEAWRRAQTT